MKKKHYQLGSTVMKGLTFLTVVTGFALLSSCKDDNGLTAGDPNYFTSSRGQFTAQLNDDVTLYLLPGSAQGMALLTYDGSNPRHWQSETTATVNVITYSGDMELPETITANGQNYTLSGIGNEAMMGCRSLTSLILPASVQTLGEGAFAICTSLATINIPEGVATIPTGCFGYCTKLSAVTLPLSVTTLGEMAFYGCSGLTSVSLNEGLTAIGERAFFDCPQLTEITIPSTVTSIGNRAFGGRSATDYSAIQAYHMKSMTPPTLEGILYEAQEGINPIIYVPAGALSAYQSAEGWNKLTIEEE